MIVPGLHMSVRVLEIVGGVRTCVRSARVRVTESDTRYLARVISDGLIA